MVRQWQTLFYQERYSQTDLATHAVASPTSSSWPRRSAASDCVVSAPKTSPTSSTRRAPSDRPVVIDFVVGADAQVWPMVAAGIGNDENSTRRPGAGKVLVG